MSYDAGNGTARPAAVRPYVLLNEIVTGVHSSVSDLEWRDKLQTVVVVVVVAVVARQTC